MSAAGQRERASKKKRTSCRLCFIPPRATFLADRLVFCEPVNCTVPEKHDAGIMRIGNCFNAYCIYLASKQASKQIIRHFFSCELHATRIEKARSRAWMQCGLDLWSIWEA